jgi:hypothetical protein
MNRTNLKIAILLAVFFIAVLLSSSLQANEKIYLSEKPLNQQNIAVVTNRAIIDINHDSILFESNLDVDHLNTSFLTASYYDTSWTYSLNSNLEELLSQDFEHENWVIFVHGDGKNLKNAIQRGKEIQDLHKVNVLVYAWPSHNPELSAIRNFKNSYSNVEKATIHFSEFLNQVALLRSMPKHAFSSGNLSMFLHSLGNYFLENIVKEDLHNSLDGSFIDNLIINAAAVEQKAHNKWVQQLSFQKRIYINSNGKDINLIGLRIFSSKKMQLGEDPEPPLASNAIYVSFTEAVGASLPPGPSHSYFFASVTDESPRIKSYYSQLMNGYEIDFTDENMFISNADYLAYSIKF